MADRNLTGNGTACPACAPKMGKRKCPYCQGTGRVAKPERQIIEETIREARAQPLPFTPSGDLDDWQDIYGMLCMFCVHQFGCSVVEGMIEMKDGGEWPSEGWVHDEGAGVSCLS